MSSQLTQAQLEDYFKNGQFDELMRAAEDEKYMRQYRRMKHKNQIYEVGDSIRVGEDVLGIIQRIISIKSLVDSSQIPLVQISLYIDKNQLKGQDKWLKAFSDFELFPTDQKRTVFFKSITAKIKVVTLEQYDSQLDENDDDIRLYYTRCAFANGQLLPPPEKLTKTCICDMPTNPDLLYIFCETCKKWIHMECVHLTEEEAKDIDNYICPKCQ